MASLATMRDGLRANLGRVTGCQISAYLLSNPSPPTLMVYAGATEYDKAFGRGLDRHVLIVQGLAGVVSDLAAQKVIEAWRATAGAQSVKAAVEHDRTLGGSVSDLRVTEVSEDRVYQPEGKGPYIGCEWTVEVLAVGTT